MLAHDCKCQCGAMLLHVTDYAQLAAHQGHTLIVLGTYSTPDGCARYDDDSHYRLVEQLQLAEA
jgi:hypothetical protein